MTTSTLPPSRVGLARLTWLLASWALCSILPVRAAQETFWPFNQFPPPAWGFSSIDGSTVSGSVPGAGTITTRRFVFTNFTGPIVLPALGNSAVYDNASTRIDVESSLDGGGSWAPYTGIGAASLALRHTNDSPGVRRFELEMSSGSIPVNGAYGAAMIRESSTLASLGELVVTATNGGFHYRGFVNFNMEVSVDGGGSWYALSPTAYVELSGPPGTPSAMSVSRGNTNLTLCWRTEASGQYQLQRISTLGSTNWVNIGSSQPGNGFQVCVTDALSPGTNQFYRVMLSP